MRKGNQIPKSIPLIATNYQLQQEERFNVLTLLNHIDIFYRVLSRVCIVSFSKPSIAPVSDEQQDAFDELDDMICGGVLSSVIGWAIQMGKKLNNKDKLKKIKGILRPHFHGRAILNWSLVALCLEEVHVKYNLP